MNRHELPINTQSPNPLSLKKNMASPQLSTSQLAACLAAKVFALAGLFCLLPKNLCTRNNRFSSCPALLGITSVAVTIPYTIFCYLDPEYYTTINHALIGTGSILYDWGGLALTFNIIHRFVSAESIMSNSLGIINRQNLRLKYLLFSCTFILCLAASISSAVPCKEGEF
jgi:hypothetical protein